MAASGGVVLRSMDAGESWATVQAGTQSHWRFWCSASGELWAAGNAGTLLRSDDDLTSRSEPIGTSVDLRAVMVDGDLAIAVGVEGAIFIGKR